MKTLYVARHATAEPHSPTGEDFDRRLALRGEAEITGVASRARDLDLGLDLIIASPAARTLATAGAYARAFGMDEDRFQTAKTIYTTDTGHLAEFVQALPESADRILLVGHNPVISRLARWLADSDDFPEFVPATVAVYAIDAERWAHVDPTLSRLIARIAPER